MHFPNSLKSAQGARDYLAYEELFELILAAKLNRRENDKLQAFKIPFKLEKIKRFLNRLPFELTGAQNERRGKFFKTWKKLSR